MTLVRITPSEFSEIERAKLSTKTVLESKRPQLDLEKAWHGIHYLLTGDPSNTKGIAGQAILGGKEAGDDVGYGPAKILSPKEVAIIAADLKNYSKETLKKRFDPAGFEKNGIYPTIWLRDGDEAFDWLMTYYADLLKFYDQAKEKGDGLLIAIR